MTTMESTGDAGDAQPTDRLARGRAALPGGAARPLATDPTDPAYVAEIESWMDSLMSGQGAKIDGGGGAAAPDVVAAPMAPLPARHAEVAHPTASARSAPMIAIAVIVLLGVVIAVQPTFFRRGPSVGAFAAAGNVVGQAIAITAPADGIILALPIAEGQEAPSGAIIARIDPVDEERSVAAARERLAASEAVAQRARRDLAAAESGVAGDDVIASAARTTLAAAETRCRDALLRFGRIARLHDLKQSSDETLAFARGTVQKEKAAVAKARSVVDALPVGPAPAVMDVATIERLRGELRQSEASVVADAHAVDRGQQRLASTSVRAPMAGIMGSHRVAIGAKVSAAEGGTPLLTLLDATRLSVEVDVDPARVTAIGVGMVVSVQSDRDPGVPILGTVRAIAPSGAVIVDIPTSARGAGFHPGMRARVTFSPKE